MKDYKYEYERNKLKKYLGDDLYNLLKQYQVIIAGGFITSLFTRNEIHDIDIYFRNKEDVYNFLTDDDIQHNWIISATEKALLFKHNDKEIQCIYFDYFKTINKLFKYFDFSVCMGAFDFKTEKFVLHQDFLKHNSQRILKFNECTRFPIISALRVQKYKEKGYQISKLEFLKILFTINKLNITSYKEFMNQIGGMYGERFNLLFDKEKLKEKDFCMEDALKMMNELSNIELDTESKITKSEQYNFANINDWYVFVSTLLNKKNEYCEFKENYYIKVNNEFKEIDIEEDDTRFIKKDVDDFIKLPIKRYKNVKKLEDERLVSYYDNNFEYIIGQKAYGRDRGIWSKSSIKECDYNSTDKNCITLELEIDDLSDINNLDDLSEVKGLKVIKIVEREDK